MTITALPTPPSRADDPATFASKGDALLGALPTFVTETNAAIVEANASVALAAGQVTLATTQAGIATTKAGDAAASELAAENAAQAAAASAGAVVWVSGTTYALGAVVWSPVNRLTYRRTIAGAGATDPSADLVNWAALNPVATQAEMQAGTEVALRAMSPLRIAEAIGSLGRSSVGYDYRLSNTQIGAVDRGKLIDMAGTYTQTFDAPATLGDGWYCYLRANGGQTTLGSELLTYTNVADLIVESYGSNLVANGTFDLDANWTKGTGWVIAAGVASRPVAAASSLTAAIPPIPLYGALLEVKFDVVITAGVLTMTLGGASVPIPATGSHTIYVQSAGTGELYFNGNASFAGSIDNLIVRMVTPRVNSALNVIVNGTFTADTNWTKGAGWTIAAGKAYGSATTGTLAAAVAPLVVGNWYAAKFDVEVTAGSLECLIGGKTTAREITTTGTYYEVFKATASTFMFDGIVAFSGTVANVICAPLFERSVLMDANKTYRIAADWTSAWANAIGPVTLGGFNRHRAASFSETLQVAASGANTLGIGTSHTYFQPFTLSLKQVTNDGEITVSPSSGLIDDLSSYVMYTGEVRMVVCDGATLRTIVLQSFQKTYIASGNFVKPPGYRLFNGYVWGGGGSTSSGASSSGGGGGCMPFSYLADIVGGSEVVVIGAGGARGSIGTGGGTTFISAIGTGAVGNEGGGIGSNGTTFAAQITAGAHAAYGGGNGAGSASLSAKSVFGGGGGGYSASYPSGVSIFGGSGGQLEDGHVPAGGSYVGMAGARGELRIWGVL